jgi:phage N-6-adenine-methyltransferase
MAHEKKGQEAGQKMGTQLFRQGAMTRRPDDEAARARGKDSKTKRSRMNQGMYSSASDEWETPQEFFDALDEIFHFTLDVCATPENAKCPRYFTKAEDGLAQPWEGICWMNPPYGREIGAWIKKAYESGKDGRAVVVCLLPSRTDTAWWHEYVLPHAVNVQFIRGRLKFSGKKNSAPFPSALVVFGQVEIQELYNLGVTMREWHRERSAK